MLDMGLGLGWKEPRVVVFERQFGLLMRSLSDDAHEQLRVLARYLVCAGSGDGVWIQLLNDRAREALPTEVFEKTWPSSIDEWQLVCDSASRRNELIAATSRACGVEYHYVAKLADESVGAVFRFTCDSLAPWERKHTGDGVRSCELCDNHANSGEEIILSCSEARTRELVDRTIGVEWLSLIRTWRAGATPVARERALSEVNERIDAAKEHGDRKQYALSKAELAKLRVSERDDVVSACAKALRAQISELGAGKFVEFVEERRMWPLPLKWRAMSTTW